MGRKGTLQSGAFNTGRVEIYRAAFEKLAGNVWSDMQRIMTDEPGAGGEQELVDFLNTSLADVYAADKKLLFDGNQDEANPTTRHLARCQPQFEFACQTITAKLTTEVKIFVRNLSTAKPPAPVRTIVIIQPPVESKRTEPAQAVIEIPPLPKLPQAPEPIDMNKTLIWVIQQRIQEKLDLRLRSMPSASQFSCVVAGTNLPRQRCKKRTTTGRSTRLSCD